MYRQINRLWNLVLNRLINLRINRQSNHLINLLQYPHRNQRCNLRYSLVDFLLLNLQVCRVRNLHYNPLYNLLINQLVNQAVSQR